MRILAENAGYTKYSAGEGLSFWKLYKFNAKNLVFFAYLFQYIKIESPEDLIVSTDQWGFCCSEGSVDLIEFPNSYYAIEFIYEIFRKWDGRGSILDGMDEVEQFDGCSNGRMAWFSDTIKWAEVLA